MPTALLRPLRSYARWAAFLFAVSSVLLGCTTVHVQQLELQARPERVCIEPNPKVVVPEFMTILEEGIRRNQMQAVPLSDVSNPSAASAEALECDLVMRYVAYQDWDFTAFLTHAEIWLERDGRQVGYAQYMLFGGLSPFKWQSARTKMEPVIDELFAPPLDG